MINVEGLTKRYGHTTAVDDLSFEVRPGRVTGSLGPNVLAVLRFLEPFGSSG
jgi:ABC-2 type transport system ATP-binding protein